MKHIRDDVSNPTIPHCMIDKEESNYEGLTFERWFKFDAHRAMIDKLDHSSSLILKHLHEVSEEI